MITFRRYSSSSFVEEFLDRVTFDCVIPDDEGPRIEERLVIATEEILLPIIADCDSFEKLSVVLDIKISNNILW